MYIQGSPDLPTCIIPRGSYTPLIWYISCGRRTDASSVSRLVFLYRLGSHPCTPPPRRNQTYLIVKAYPVKQKWAFNFAGVCLEALRLIHTSLPVRRRMPRSNDDPRRHVQVLSEQVGAVSQVLVLLAPGFPPRPY